MPQPPDSPGPRLLAVLSAVAQAGALDLAGVQAATGIPRSACYRALATLEGAGWLRRRLSDGAFLPVAAALAPLAAVATPGVLADRVAGPLAPVLRRARIAADIARLDPGPALVVVETSRGEGPAPLSEPFFGTPLTLAALAVCPPETRLALVRSALDSADEEDRRAVTSGRFTRAVAACAAGGAVWDTGTQSLTLPLDGGDGLKGALRLEGTGATRRSENRLRGLAAELRRALPDLLPEADAIRARYWPVAAGRPPDDRRRRG